jgi:hemoglobin
MHELTQPQIQKLVSNFYAKVQNDEILGPIFNEIAKVDWEHHLPLLTQFWSSVMLGTKQYSGNPMQKHIELARKTNLAPEHFARWLELFSQEANVCLSEKAAQLIINRASLIASAIQQRLSLIKSPNNLI